MGDPNQDVFVAEDNGPPRRRYWISRDPETGRNDTVRGWSFAFDEAGSDGAWGVGLDSWEEWFFEILRYPLEYTSMPMVWRRKSDGEVVDLETLQFRYDGKRVLPHETPESAGLRR